jgi:hypothetical protein
MRGTFKFNGMFIFNSIFSFFRGFIMLITFRGLSAATAILNAGGGGGIGAVSILRFYRKNK